MSTNRLKKSKALSFLEDISGGPLTFAQLLNSIRVGDGLSYAAFAEKLGISRSHLCDIEKGRKGVSLSRAIEFAGALGYSKDQFVRLALQTQISDVGLKYRVVIEAA
jgi:transcriptional regulator with XRE-family HTH domain